MFIVRLDYFLSRTMRPQDRYCYFYMLIFVGYQPADDWRAQYLLRRKFVFLGLGCYVFPFGTYSRRVSLARAVILVQLILYMFSSPACSERVRFYSMVQYCLRRPWRYFSTLLFTLAQRSLKKLLLALVSVPLFSRVLEIYDS